LNLLETLRNIWAIEDLRKRVLFTFGLLAVYRLGSHIPTPGVDPVALAEFFKAMQGGVFGSSTLLRRRAAPSSVFALGIMPYISASIILQLLTVVWPYLENSRRRGDGAAQDQPVHALRHGGPVHRPVARRRLLAQESERAGGAPLVPTRVQDALWGVGFPIMTILTLTPAPPSSCGSVSRSPSAASATASR